MPTRRGAVDPTLGDVMQQALRDGLDVERRRRRFRRRMQRLRTDAQVAAHGEDLPVEGGGPA